jgi:hypothetical protein
MTARAVDRLPGGNPFDAACGVAVSWGWWPQAGRRTPARSLGLATGNGSGIGHPADEARHRRSAFMPHRLLSWSFSRSFHQAY